VQDNPNYGMREVGKRMTKDLREKNKRAPPVLLVVPNLYTINAVAWGERHNGNFKVKKEIQSVPQDKLSSDAEESDVEPAAGVYAYGESGDAAAEEDSELEEEEGKDPRSREEDDGDQEEAEEQRKEQRNKRNPKRKRGQEETGAPQTRTAVGKRASRSSTAATGAQQADGKRRKT
jgi:hypothetical protein